jgi:peptide/nickel transport system ATP-binding protein
VADSPILDVRDLTVEYLTGDKPARAVDKVSFTVSAGEFLGVVGESGCGKSTMLFGLAGLLQPPAERVGGQVIFKGQDLCALDEHELRKIRWKGYSVVMQSAMNALNPVKTVGSQFADAMRAHGTDDKAEIAQRSAEVMKLVGIDAIHLKSYPHQLSGGMRQRTMIAMALLYSPDLVVMDEPTSALDVVAQRSLMVQIKELQERLGFAVVFVTHDMSLVTKFSDRLAVMYAGKIVEIGPTTQVFQRPSHPYTRGLFDAFPSIYGERKALTGIPGAPPDLSDLPTGCSFQPRCPSARPECTTVDPEGYAVEEAEVRCVLFDPVRVGAEK